MNIKDYANQLKTKFDLVSASWNKLTIEQLEQVENLLEKLIQESNGNIPRRKYPPITEEMYKEIETLRANNISWDEIAQKYSYKDGQTICVTYCNYKKKNYPSE